MLTVGEGIIETIIVHAFLHFWPKGGNGAGVCRFEERVDDIGIHVFRRVNALHFESVRFRTYIQGKDDNFGTDGWLLA